MKNVVVILIVLCFLPAIAQEPPRQAMESKAKELIRVLSLSDKDGYRKFIKANYTEALINKKMRLRVEGGPASSASEGDKSDPLEEKVNMYTRLHDDLGEGKIVSMKQTVEKLQVEAEGSTGVSLSFTLTFQKETPYLIDGFSVQMVMGR
jgi:hypothetical protein